VHPVGDELAEVVLFFPVVLRYFGPDIGVLAIERPELYINGFILKRV
jgi:hypothetical protein